MKRIKVMLLSLFVLAAVGGVLAFKARGEFVCLYSGPVGTTCPILIAPKAVAVTTDLENGIPNAYFADKTGEFCPATVASELCTLLVTYETNE